MLVPLFLIAGCDANPVSTQSTNNPKVQVDLLFVHDGCAVYRFYDGGEGHYYAVCGRGLNVTTSSEQPCGKGCVREEQISTVEQ